MTPTLTDRYVGAVLRAAPVAQRTDLDLEVRGLIADAIEARIAADPGATGDDAATERAALIELGDPAALAARYTDRTQYLIGPALFPVWRRLLSVLLPILVPIIGLIVLAASLYGGATVGSAIVSGGMAAFGVGLQTVFWVTLVFAVIERTTGTTGVAVDGWSLDDLPDLPATGGIGVIEFGATIVANAFVVAGLLWVQLQPPIVIDGSALPLFDPALWSFWLPWFLVVTVGEILFTVALFVRGRWTWSMAVINAALGAAFAIPLVYLIQNDLLLNPALVDAVTATSGSAWLAVTGTVTAVVVALIVGWDAIDGARKARRATNPR